MGASTSRLDSKDTPIVTIPGHGEIQGTSVIHTSTNKAKTHRYVGVPYALPPTGSRRWRKPAPLPSSFQYDLDGKRYEVFGDICPQPGNHGMTITPSPPILAPRPSSEDCLLLNVWVPARPPPVNGFPVLFFIHGGWLQVGNPHHDMTKDPSDLIAPVDEGGAGLQAIVVSPGYRLGIFGFLAMADMPEGERGNFGFWDQRLALEWTYENVGAFGGNKDNITLGGLSAGAHSAHSQALYEYNQIQKNPRRPLFKRLFFQSNAAMVPAKSLSETTEQVEELLRQSGLSHTTPTHSRIDELRKIDADELMNIVPRLHLHTFRAVRGKDEFVSDSWSSDMLGGGFARWCREEDIMLLMGECANEDSVYSRVNPPTGPDFPGSLYRQLHNYYPEDVVKDLIPCYQLPASSSSDPTSDWADIFGKAASDSQVYASERLLVQLMSKDGNGPTILRYHINYRPAFLDQYCPKSMGVGHGFDDSLWWFCTAALLEPEHLTTSEKEAILSTFRRWLTCFVSFVAGHKNISSQWYEQHPSSDDVLSGKAIRRLGADLSISVVQDDRWEDKARVVECLYRNLERVAAM